jgi:hypothetical protein
MTACPCREKSSQRPGTTSLQRCVICGSVTRLSERVTDSNPSYGKRSRTVPLRSVTQGDDTRARAGLTRQVNAELAANPALARKYLSQAEYEAGIASSRIAAAQYGNAVERIVAARIADDPVLGQVFRRVGGPSNPDFTAFGRNFDITTATRAQVFGHMKRPGYGQDLIVVAYERPTTFTTFPGGQ